MMRSQPYCFEIVVVVMEVEFGWVGGGADGGGAWVGGAQTNLISNPTQLS